MDGLLGDLLRARDLASASISDMQRRLDASDAEVNTSEREKQELIRSHGEKQAEMKALKTSFTVALKEDAIVCTDSDAYGRTHI